MRPLAAPTVIRCTTTALSAPAVDLLGALPHPTGALSFVQHGRGLVGWGRHAAISVTGRDAAAQIADWYARELAALVIDDDVHAPGTGPVCFVSLAFAPDEPSVAVIPQVVIGGDGTSRFVTRLGVQDDEPAAPVTSPGLVTYSDSGLSATNFTTIVADAITRIRNGEADKVVLAHGLEARCQDPVDERYLLRRLAARYPSCVAFAVEGLIGASPEMLIHRRGRSISSRVLAGTAWPEHAGTDPEGRQVAAHLLASGKDVGEHRFAVESVASVLRPITDRLNVPESPSPLPLANLTHLATDIAGELAAGPTPAPTALEIAALLHPTAAVGGTPRRAAQQLIARLEPGGRGRYAAPVGWMDARGDGEFAIALRCAQVDGRSVRLMAGCGIVADSDPATEAREAQIKMVPIRDALEGL